jgi:hypothetical protein
LARGDRRTGKAILAAWNSGCKFDGWDECFDWNKWAAAFRGADIEESFYANRSRSYDENFPWDHIDSGVTKCFLMVHDKLAEAGKPIEDCRSGVCLNCGVDDLLPDEYSCTARRSQIQEG